MSQTSKNERAEQIWSGWSKLGVGGANLVWVEQIWSLGGSNLERVEQMWGELTNH